MKRKRSESHRLHLEALLDETEKSAVTIFLRQAELNGRRNVDGGLITLGKIAIICRALLSSSPPQPPEYVLISSGWRDLYGGKPIAVQTLKNSYRWSISAWLDAFRELEGDRVRLNVGKTTTSRTRFEELAVNETVENQSQYISTLEARVKDLQLEVNDLRNMAKQRDKRKSESRLVTSSRVTSPEPSVELLNYSPLREWFQNAGKPGSLISMTENGVELTQFARPGRTIMSRKVLDVLRNL